MNTQSLPYDNITQFLQILHDTYAGDHQAVHRATGTLQSMAQEPLKFVDSIMGIMTLKQNDEDALRAKNAAAISLTRCLLELMKENKLPLQNRNYTINAVVAAMFSEFVPLPLKVNLQYFLLLLYTVDVGSEMTNDGLRIVKEKLNTNDIHAYPPAFLILQAIINTSQAPQESISNWFEELKGPLINIGGGLARGIHLEVQELNNGSQQPEKIASIFVGLKILKMWILTLHEFIKLLGQNNIKLNKSATYLKVIVVQEMIVQILSAVLVMNINTDKQIKNCIFSTSGFKEVDQLLNNVKTSALNSFCKVLDLMKEVNTVVSLSDNKFFAFSRNHIISPILSSLIVYFKHDSLILDDFLSDKDLSELVVEALGFLIRMADYQELNPLFAACIKHLIVDVCFALISSTSAEVDDFKNNPDQFSQLAFDTIGEKKSQTPKTQAAKLLFKLCGVIDGALSYVAVVTMCIVEYSMVSDRREDIPANHKDLVDYQNSIIIAKTDSTIRVETCLLILTILSVPIGKREDLILMVESLLKAYSSFFLGGANPIIKARVCLLLSCYVHSIFKEEEKKELFDLYLNFLLESAGIQIDAPGNEALVEQANASLYAMWEREFLVIRLAPYVCDFLERLSTVVQYSKSLKTFDTIHEIVTSYPIQVLEKPQLLILLIGSLITRWHVEFEIASKDPKGKKFVLTKIWNVIRGIASREEYIIPFQDEIEKALEPMFAYLEANNTLDFDEDILGYTATVTKISKKVSATNWKIFQMLPKMFERYQGLISIMFPALNNIIVYGHQIINQSENDIKTLIEIGISALYPSHHSADEASFSEAAVLLQIIIQYLEPISPEQLEKILLACYEKLQTAEKGYLKARLGGVFLCSFVKYFEKTQQFLINIQAITPLMDLFLKNVLVFETHAYDRKLLIIGLSCLLPQINISDEITNRYPEIFDITISLLRFVGYMEQTDAKKGLQLFEDSDEERKTSKQNILMAFLNSEAKMTARIDDIEKNSNDDDSDLNSDDDDDEDYDDNFSGKGEANQVIKNLESSLKKEDEFMIFKKSVLQMKEVKGGILEELLKTLPPKKMEFLKDVLKSQRVPTNKEGTRSEARIVVKAGAKKIANFQPGGNFANL